jgi:hypothetical protein
MAQGESPESKPQYRKTQKRKEQRKEDQSGAFCRAQILPGCTQSSAQQKGGPVHTAAWQLSMELPRDKHNPRHQVA